MARNRKGQSGAIRFGPALRAILLCALIVACGVGYIWQEKQIEELGATKKKREVRLDDLREQNNRLRKQLATLQSPLFLDQRVKELKLGLTRPDTAQVWSLPEPVAEPNPALAAVGTVARQYAAKPASEPETP